MKHHFKKLAIKGGKPAFDYDLHVGRPNIGDRAVLMQRINEMLDRNQLTNMGPYVQELEKRLQDFLGVKHVICMTNGTIALEIAIRALDLSGEVIIPSFTFVATAHALQWQQIKPVFADVDPQSHMLDPLAVEKMITPQTTGILGVHLWGRAAQVNELKAIAARHNLKLLFDAAHALNVTYGGRYIGSFGNAEVFSFHATKFFNTFEGGAVATNDDVLAEKIRLMSNFGFAGRDNVIYIGTNGKMSEISAAMGLTSLESMNGIIDRNKQNYHDYLGALADIPGLRIMTYDEKEKYNYQYIVVEVDPEESCVDRDRLVEILHAERVIARRYFYPGCHRMEPYRSYQPHAGLLLPHTEELSRRVMTLPTGLAVGKNEIETIAAIIRQACTSKEAAHGNRNEEAA